MKDVFTVRIEDENPVHTRIAVYNRGGKSGTLVVNTGDADEFIRRVTGGVQVNQSADVVSGTMTGIVINNS